MIIKKIKLENIRSYESQEIIFPEGSTVLAGDIGSGKTSILLAIEFALFGLQPGQKGASLLRNGATQGKVILEIELDGKRIILERGLKKSKTVNQDYAKIVSEDLDKDLSVTELKNRVLELLNYPKEFAKKTNLLYRFTVYTPQEEMKQIILENPETRLDTLRHIFGIDKYKIIKENTAVYTARLREQIRNYEGQITSLEELRKKLDEKNVLVREIEVLVETLKKELESRTQERKKSELELEEIELKIEEKKKYEKEAEKTGIMLLGKKEIILDCENDLKILKNQIEESRKNQFSQEDYHALEKSIKELELQQDEKNKSYIELLSKINSLNLKLLELEKSKSQISSLVLCPTCFQSVSEDYKSNISRKFSEDLDRIKKELIILSSEKDTIIKSLNEIKSLGSWKKKGLDELKLLKIKFEGIKEKEARLELLDKKKLQAEKDIILLEKQVESLKEASSLLKKFDLQYQEKLKRLEDLKRNERLKELDLTSKIKERDMTLIQIFELSEEIQEKERIKLKFIELASLEDWLSNSFIELINFTERNIMLKLREEFSKQFNEWFNILVPEIFSVRLDEDFTPIIEQKDYSLDYSFLSGGERTAIALAYRLGLNQVLNSLLSKIKTRDIVILDEPTDGFSEQQLDKMRDVLNQLKAKQLIIVSHESKIESFVQNIIKFKKESGVTIVEA